jgi:sugar/nucleoside kinase (ribokinase family)
VVALSNLCVDIVVPVAELPSADVEERRKLLGRLTAQPPPVESWEVGGNSNFLIAASRLGLTAASIGHLGDDVYGRFFRDVMAVSRERARRGPEGKGRHTSGSCYERAREQGRGLECT